MKAFMLAILFIFLLAAAISAADSPIDKGSVTLGGAISYQSGLREYKYQTLFTSYVECGIFIGSGILVGSNFIYEKQVGKSGYGSAHTLSGVGPMIGFYHNLTPSRSKVAGSIFHYLRISINYLNLKNYCGIHSENTNLSLGTGLNLMISNGIALDGGAILGIDRTNGEYQLQNILFGMGFSIYLY